MNDRVQRFLFEYAPIRGEIVQLDATWRAVLERHDYPPAVRDLLGEMMAAAALLAATLKFSGTLIMQIQGSGPVRLLVVECTSDYHMRATAKWQGVNAAAAAMPLCELVGDGKFAITIDPGTGGQNYQGIVALEGNSVAALLENYMQRSEQLDTRLWLTARDTAAGLLLQKLPEHEEGAPVAGNARRRGQESTSATANHSRARHLNAAFAQKDTFAHSGGNEDAWRRATLLADSLTAHELATLGTNDILRRLYPAEDVRVFRPKSVSFRCSCSRDRVTAMLRMIGVDEVRSIVAERGEVEVHCEFCYRRYSFDGIEAEQIFAADHARAPGTTRH